MAKRFPHLKDAPDAFGPGRELYEQIPGAFDQGRWREDAAHAKLTCVPWCGDYDNVVAFADDADRDAWLNAQEGYAFETDWRRPPEGTYRVEVPYATALMYNYLVLDLPMPTSEGNPLPGATEEGVRRLCYFVEDARPVAGSTTELDISLDVWTTFSAGVQVRFMQLAQGHAPMASVTPERFLADPLENGRYLLAPDVDAGGVVVARSAETCNLADSTVTLVITSSRLNGSWGDKYGQTPAGAISYVGASASPVAWVVDDGDLDDFLNDVTSQHPSFLQTVLAIASAPATLVNIGGAVSFCGHTVRIAHPTNRELPLIDLSVDDFDLPDEYRGIAKLYTYPYAYLEIADESGSVSTVRVEETRGSLGVYAQLSLAWPYVAVDTTLTGRGSSGAHDSLSWEILGRTGGTTLVGRWFEELRRHDVPLFAVRESASTSYDWGAHHTNEQRRLAAQNAYASETASASTANANALASNSTARTNSANNASNMVANNTLTVAASAAVAARNQGAAAEGAQLSNEKLSADTNEDIDTSSAAYEAEQEGLAVAATNNNAQMTASVATTAVSMIANTAASIMTADIGGAVGSIASGISSGVQAGVSWSCANASISVSQSNSTTMYNATTAAALRKSSIAQNYTTQSTALQQRINVDNVDTQNQTANSITTNNANLTNQNAANVKTTADANANRTLSTENANAARTRDTALSAIANDTAQAALGNVLTHGEQRPGNSSLRPMLVQATVVTQTPGAIAYAGEHMLRFGYACDFAWEVTDWCPCERFCYWRASDVWLVGGGNVAERYQREIRDILLRGVTVWKVPEDIGRVSVHDNGF